MQHFCLQLEAPCLQCSFLLTIVFGGGLGAFCLQLELFYLQLELFLLTVELSCLQWESASNKPLNRL